MTNLESAVKLVWDVFDDIQGGEIYVQKILLQIYWILQKQLIQIKIKFIGVRPGEKINEIMISKDDSQYTYSYNNYYKILPSLK